MRQMIGIANVKWLAEPPAEDDHPGKVAQWHSQDEQRHKDGPNAGLLASVEVRENGHDRQEVTDEMTAGVTKKRGGPRKIVGKKTQQRTTGEQSEESDKVLA